MTSKWKSHEVIVAVVCVCVYNTYVFILQPMGSQTVGHTLRTEQQFTFKRKGGDKKKGEDLTIFLK